MRRDSKFTIPEQLCAAKLIINETNSWSGLHTIKQSFKLWNLSTNWDDPLISGSHHQSLLDIYNKRADFAAIDAVSWFYLKRLYPDFKSLAVLNWTQQVPALPLITHLPKQSQPDIRPLLISMPKSDFKTVTELGITGFKHFTLEQYRKALNY